MTAYNSQGYEIGNVLDRATFPAARKSRTGPPPPNQQPAIDTAGLRGVPIRSRLFAFDVRSGGTRSRVASPGYVGPGLVKRLDLTIFFGVNGSPMPFFSMWYDTSPYITATGILITEQPHGTPLWQSGIADDQPSVFTQEGGLSSSGVQVAPASFLLDFSITDAQFYLALEVRNQVGAGFAVSGSLVVYEGVLPSDYPAILG